jgi:SAM-dependent methyltransferase
MINRKAMETTAHSSRVREDWIKRQRAMGNQPRSVLMKGLHPRINQTIDLWHRLVMRAAFSGAATSPSSLPSLDIGCGYGRLANEATALGLKPLVGLDFAHGFCARFQQDHGLAVCGDLAKLPFKNGAFSAAYSVTSYMYLPLAEARKACLELDRCLAHGAHVLVLEPSLEFNSLVRAVLRKKRNEALAMPGFSMAEFRDQLVPGHWRRLACGSCSWTTILLPLLVVFARCSPLYRYLEHIALRLDAPVFGRPRKMAALAMYRWSLYEKSA